MPIHRLCLALVIVSVAASGSPAGLGTAAEGQCIEPVGQDVALAVGVSAILAAHAATAFVGPDGTESESVEYQGLRDFLVRNPGCCTFTLFGEDDFAPTPEWVERNSFYGFVRATFGAFRAEDAGQRKVVNITRMVAVTSCGKAIWYDVDDDGW